MAWCLEAVTELVVDLLQKPGSVLELSTDLLVEPKADGYDVVQDWLQTVMYVSLSLQSL